MADFWLFRGCGESRAVTNLRDVFVIRMEEKMGPGERSKEERKNEKEREL